MIRIRLFLWTEEKLGDQLSKALLALGHVLDYAGLSSGHKGTGTVIVVALSGQGLRGWLGL